MKLVINTCYGGFRLSNEAVAELVKIKSNREIYVYKLTCYMDKNFGYYFTYVKKPFGYREPCIYSTKDYGEETLEIEDGDLVNLEYYKNNREDRDLISIVEKMGSKRASGMFSYLKVVEIPDDIEYYIEEFDGKEVVHEAHRTWQ